ncbi:MAG: signal recognition particle protein [Candidatus Latescibacteria bacterium]|nr:signal recognition particle protein [Candidatus Latescibacterota bacterium]
MFDSLTARLEGIFKRLRGRGKLSESDVREALREIRRVLLEADVNYKVVKGFIARVEQRAVGETVLKSFTPGQQVIKIVYDELTHLMGDSPGQIAFSHLPPTVVMLVGLQGSGKTTTAAKLATFLRSKGRNPMMAAVDVRRPAAAEQLQVLGRSLNIPVYSEGAEADPVEICLHALSEAKQRGCDLLILDTAGRLHIDEELMDELVRIKQRLQPQEILLVADGMTGQDAVNVARAFLQRLDFDGVVLTKLDGDARGGAALSIKAVTGKPIKFVGVGEKCDDLEVFHPDRMASRILGMGDIASLVEKAQQAIDLEKTEQLEKRVEKERLTLEDFLNQLQQLKKMGPLEHLLGMIPGPRKLIKNLQVDENDIIRIEAIINSMTRQERRNPHIIDGSRRRRIAKGSGTTVQEVNSLLKQFQMMQKMVKSMTKAGGMNKIPLPF